MSQPQRHKDTEGGTETSVAPMGARLAVGSPFLTQRRKDAKTQRGPGIARFSGGENQARSIAYCPQITQMSYRPGRCRIVITPRSVLGLNRKEREDRKVAVESQSEPPRQGEALAVRRPGTACLSTRAESKLSSRVLRHATCASAGLAPSFFYREMGGQNRRAPGASADENGNGDGCLYPETLPFSPAAGDSIACRSATQASVSRLGLFYRIFASSRLGVFALSAVHIKCDGSAALRLCDSAFFLCVSVTLWFASWPSFVSSCLRGCGGGKWAAISNSEFRIPNSSRP
jgi:hypothetical protein